MMSRALIEIFSNPELAATLAFRGGTAMAHNLREILSIFLADAPNRLGENGHRAHFEAIFRI
jgi:hypothetical protein